jgi:hypothetical protein
MNARMLWLVALVLFGSMTLAQISTSSLRGTVVDPKHAAIGGATVTIQSAASGVVERTLTTDPSGGYSAVALAPGSYKVSVHQPGFADQMRPIELQVGRIETLDFKLSVGTVQEKVTVIGTAPVVDRENSEIGGVVDVNAVGSLPLNGRQLGDLAALVPGVLPAPNFDPIKTQIFNVSAGGSDGRSSNFSVDGGENSDIVNGGLLQNFTIEGVQEFYVASSRYGADQGRALGAAVNVVTKSGTNAYHGSYFVFYRNQDLNAQDPFQAKKTAESIVAAFRDAGSGPSQSYNRRRL